MGLGRSARPTGRTGRPTARGHPRPFRAPAPGAPRRDAFAVRPPTTIGHQPRRRTPTPEDEPMSRHRAARGPRPVSPRFRARLEPLEDRTLLAAPIIVRNTND